MSLLLVFFSALVQYCNSCNTPSCTGFLSSSLGCRCCHQGTVVEKAEEAFGIAAGEIRIRTDANQSKVRGTTETTGEANWPLEISRQFSCVECKYFDIFGYFYLIDLFYGLIKLNGNQVTEMYIGIDRKEVEEYCTT